jgi:hypothetical protein
MKRKIWILFCLGGLIVLSGCGETPVTVTNGKTFTIEYDHQQSWTCFEWGLNRTQDAFKKANTTLNIVRDNTELTDSLVKFSDRFNYVAAYRKLDEFGDVFYPGYLCGIEAFVYENGTIIDTLAG